MTVLLHISGVGPQYWRRTSQGWQALEGAPDPKQPVWVVTDLAEESFVDIDVPRVYGRDRRDFIARQLATRFPDTPYRSRPDFRSRGTLLERLLPSRYTLFGISGTEKINEELDAKKLTVAALCPTSLLLTRIGQRKRLHADLFVVLPSRAGLRIVFLKDRIPVLTRLAPIPDQVKAQADEIIRTLRYLENMRTIPRDGPPPPVMILGNAAEFAEPLGAARLELIEPPSRWNVLQGDWRLPLFDLAIKEQPFGQLAPIERRVEHLARALRKWARVAAGLSLCAGVAATIANVWSLFDIKQEIRRDELAVERLHGELSSIDQRIATLVQSPDLVRRALDLNAQELESAPSLDTYMRKLGPVLEGYEHVRVTSLDWRLLDAGTKPCSTHTRTAPNVQTPADTSADTPAVDHAERGVELFYEVSLAAGVTPREKARTLHDISARLSKLPGAKILGDAATDLAKSTLRGGNEPTADNERNAAWCLTLPWGHQPDLPKTAMRSEAP